jgi:transcription elongation factor
MLLNSSISDFSQIDVPIGFVLKLRNASMELFKHAMYKEVFIIKGNMKGYRAMLYDIGHETCTVAIHGQKHIVLKRSEVVTR